MDTDTHKQIMTATNFEEFVDLFRKGCTRCTLSHHYGNYPVTYRGNPQADIMLIGEGPGVQERQMGKPFVGVAGQLLDRIMAAIGLDTNIDMLLWNAVLCRPVAQRGSGKQNYTPKKQQIIRCFPFCEKAIELVQPKITIACGVTALHILMKDNNLTMSMQEGKWLKDDLFAMAHPASLIHKEAKAPREEYLRAKRKTWESMKYFQDTYREKLQS